MTRKATLAVEAVVAVVVVEATLRRLLTRTTCNATPAVVAVEHDRAQGGVPGRALA